MKPLITRAAAATTLLVTAVLACACSQAVVGSGAPEFQDPSKVVGLTVTTGSSGLKPGVGDPGIAVVNGDGGEIDRLAANSIVDVQDYWTEQFPDQFGKSYKRVGKIVSYESTGAGVNLCGGLRKEANAFYCAGEDTIAWDRAELLPRFEGMFGPISVTAVLAHEAGHAVQARLGQSGAPTIVKEQQADCYTGSYARWVAEGKSRRFELSTGPGLNQIMSTLAFIRDETGKSAEGANAHGDAFDRTSAFQFGFNDGPKRCARIDSEEVSRRISQQEFGPKERDLGLGKGNLRVTDASSVKDLENSLKAAFPSTRPSFSARPSSCPGVKATSPASYCESTNTVSFDPAALAKIGTPAKAGEQGGIGDFAAFAEVASRYSLAVQKSAKLQLTGPNAALRTACLTGVWAGSITEGKNGALTLSPGDLDEAVAEMLQQNSLISGDLAGKSVGAGFSRVEAFRDGFTSAGSNVCAVKYR